MSLDVGSTECENLIQQTNTTQKNNRDPHGSLPFSFTY